MLIFVRVPACVACGAGWMRRVCVVWERRGVTGGRGMIYRQEKEAMEPTLLMLFVNTTDYIIYGQRY